MIIIWINGCPIFWINGCPIFPITGLHPSGHWLALPQLSEGSHSWWFDFIGPKETPVLGYEATRCHYQIHILFRKTQSRILEPSQHRSSQTPFPKRKKKHNKPTFRFLRSLVLFFYRNPDAPSSWTIFAYISPKNDPVLWVNISAPWSVWERF